MASYYVIILLVFAVQSGDEVSPEVHTNTVRCRLAKANAASDYRYN